MNRVTTYDIARACGVSQATIDRALNNRSNIKKETRELILQTAAEMNYRPSNLPTYLKMGKTNIIGIIVPAALPFYSELLLAITKTANMRGYHSMVSFSEFNIEQEKHCLAELLKINADGIVIFPIGSDGSEIKKIIQAGVPVVTLIRKVKNYNFDFISVNYEHAAENATQYLINLKHKKIGYFTIWDNSSNLYTYNKRLKGIRNIMEKNGLSLKEKHIINDTENYQIVDSLINDDDLPTALICFNDVNAIGLVSYLGSKGIQVPGDISIISFDNISMLRYFSPGITSIAYPFGDIAEAAIDTLIKRVNEPCKDVNEYLFDTQMIHRNSCKRLSGRS